MKAHQNSKHVNNSSIVNLHYQVDCAREAQEQAIEAFLVGELSEDRAIEAVNYVEALELQFVKAGGCYTDLYH
ncbi:MAG: hypothetical protein V4732_07860 [Pseudomonadota bacterium]